MNDIYIEVKRENVFEKIKMWFKKLIKKEVDTQYNSNIENKKEIKNENFIKSIKIDDKSKLIILQNKLKNNEIQISDLTDEELKDMIELYEQQIQQKKEILKRYRKIIFQYNN